MANIYLRVPTYVSQFYRGLDDKHVLGEFDPIVFCDFQHEFILMKNSLQLVTEADQLQSNSWCYSQRAWRNMLSGKPPAGGMPILSRDPEQWLTMQELCTLLGEKNVQKMDGYDYLCIQIPTEVLLGDVIRRTNASYNLMPKEAMAMSRLLRVSYIHTFLDWLIQDRRHCNKIGLYRPIGVTIERFFERYYIYVGKDKKERESMYRMSRRWIEAANIMTNDRVDFSKTDLGYVSDKEMEQLEHYDFINEIENEM